jgi:hypothetical protein
VLPPLPGAFPGPARRWIVCFQQAMNRTSCPAGQQTRAGPAPARTPAPRRLRASPPRCAGAREAYLPQPQGPRWSPRRRRSRPRRRGQVRSR